MITPLITLGSVAVLCSAGFLINTAFNWLDDVEVELKNKKIKLGNEKKGDEREVFNSDRINSVSKRFKSDS